MKWFLICLVCGEKTTLQKKQKNHQNTATEHHVGAGCDQKTNSTGESILSAVNGCWKQGDACLWRRREWVLEALLSSKMAEWYFSSARASQGKAVLTRFHQANFHFILFYFYWTKKSGNSPMWGGLSVDNPFLWLTLIVKSSSAPCSLASEDSFWQIAQNMSLHF